MNLRNGIKRILGTKSRKILFKNFSSLVSVQIASYIVPLIVLPYLARVIGVEKFGTVMFAQAIVFYFTILTNFGFNFYGPREISIVRDDKEKLRQTFWDIIYSRFFLCVLSILIYVALVFSIPRFRNEMWVFIFSFGFVIGHVLFPIWFFQGIEKMTYIAIFNFVMKILYLISVFAFIKAKSDYIFVPLLYSTSQIIVGIVSLSIIIFSFNLRPVGFKFKRIFGTLKKSFALFVSNISISIYTKIPPVLLGFLAGDIYVGYYSAAEKLFQAWMGIQHQLGVTLYPHISKMAAEKNREQTLNFIRKAFLVTVVLAVPVTLVVFIFAKPIVTIIFGKEFLESVSVLRILSFLFIIIGMSNIFAMQTMLSFSMDKELVKIFIVAGLIMLFLSPILILFYKQIGAALSFFSAEVYITGATFYELKRKGINPIPKYSIIKKFLLYITNY